MTRCKGWVIAAVCSFFLAACGGGDDSPSTGGSGTATATAPTITAQPATQSVVVGQAATFSVTATGSATLAYQWLKGGTAIAGATGSTYTTPATVASDNGASFTVTVSNAQGSVTSGAATLSVAASGTTATTGSVDVTTYKNDNLRSGLNAAETTLTTSNVVSSKFGKLRSLSVDGKVDAQPLVLSQLTIGGAAHNVVFVATEHDSVYAFDADTGTQLWKVSLLASGETSSDSHGCDQVEPEIGITSTPVIDRAAGTHGVIYLVALTKAGGVYHHRLHALDVTTGASVAGPTEIGAMVTTQGGGTNTFDPAAYNERSALTLVSGTLYLTFTSHCDAPPYSGWVMAYGETSLARTAVINLGPNSQNGPAIWMSGGGPGVDSSGNLYLLTANGAFDTSMTAGGFPSGGDYGNSFVKITNSGTALSVTDYFAMYNAVSESSMDADLGSGAEMLLPDTQDSTGATRHLVLGAGKDGNLYVVDRDNMGKFNATTNNIYQQLSGLGSVFSSPAFFNNMVFYGPVNSGIKQFHVTAGKLVAGAVSGAQFSYPGSAIAVSANGTANGIVWAHENTTTAALHAFNASDLTELYNSNQASGSRDHFGTGNKFITPTIANGKVFVGTTNSVAVFGLLN